MDPAKFLTDLNRTIFKNIERTRTDKHITLSFLDYDGERLTISGQHEDMIVIRRNGNVERIDTGDLGLPVGLEADISSFVDTREIPFATGDMVVLHTDGVTEAENSKGELFGFDRLLEDARRLHGGTAEEVVDGILDDLMAYIGTQKIHDDITLVVMRHR
jgi:sigma-B regulation protein RsbU (phosphoserine phosphatase)